MATTPIRLPDRSDAPPVAQELTFIGNATVLLRYAGFTILTDPNFLHRGDHAKLGGGLRSRRLTEPALTIDELPPLDFVVLSHHHGDHFDEIAAARLDKRLPILTTAHAARKLKRQGFHQAVALQTWESRSVVRGDREVQVTAMPGTHGPGPVGALMPPVMGSLLEFGPFRVYISGDTVLFDRLRDIPRRYPDIDFALVHLGGTRVLGVLLTMDADQGVEALRIVAPRTAIPIHYNDYTVMKSPLADFRLAVARATLPTTVRYVTHGDTVELGPKAG